MHTLNKYNYEYNCYYTLGSHPNINSTFHLLNNNLNYMLSTWYYYSCCSQHCKINYTAYKYLKSCQVCIQSSTGIFCQNPGMIHLNCILCKHQHCYTQCSLRHKLCKFRCQDKNQFYMRYTYHSHSLRSQRLLNYKENNLIHYY